MSTPVALVVDDDEDIRAITELALARVGGWEVVTADRGARALEIARERKFSVILLDLMMPQMDGIETASRLLADPATADVPIILVTAKAMIGDAQPWDGVAIAGVIPKPYNPMTLAADVSAMLGWA
ncbi:response regulator [Nocardioides alkalitolerans]|uniref:response regulator n=1 Tax=Nocardioides alkalitolerans TaxID=281714 RepID=UPI00048AC50D|nr:response regulator [Nocardioides alkalitolerans]